MNDYNSVTLLGHLGQDPEVFKIGSKPPFVKVQIATNKTWKKDGQRHSKVNWNTVIFNRKLAELAEQYLQKGDRILVTGELVSQTKVAEDGKKQKRVFVQARELRFLTPKKAQEASVDADDVADVVENVDESEEIPF